MQRQLKVLICSGIFPPEAGGPATYSEKLALGLTRLGHAVKVITYTSKPQTRHYPFPVIEIRRRSFKPWHYFRYFLAVKKLNKDADVFYAQDPVSSGYPTYLAAKILKKPYLVKVTGDYSWERAVNRGFTDKLIDEFQNLIPRPAPIKRIREIQLLVCRSARVVITPSEYLKNLVAAWGIEKERIETVYNAVELPQRKSSKAQTRVELAVKPSEFLIVSAGRPVKWKGFELLREAVAELKNSYPQIRLEVLFDTPKALLQKYLYAADLFVLNTGYEGLSHLILEAMASGAVVVTTNVGGNPEIIQNGVNGILIEYNNKPQIKDAILKLYQHSQLRGQLLEGARKTLEQFKPLRFEYMVQRTLEILQQCAS